jgi:hypothetical protein
MDTGTLVRHVRRFAKDFPNRTRVADVGGITGAATTITLPSGDVGKFPSPGAVVEFDDGSDHRVVVLARDEAGNTITISDAIEGTTAVSHDENTPILIRPRFGFLEIEEALNFVLDVEMWPSVWVPRETTLAWQSANDYFSPTVSDIAEVVHAYQLSGGSLYRVNVELLSETLADETNFPNGALLVSGAADSSTIYLSYRAVPSVSNLTAPLEKLAALGTAAHLLMLEESGQVAPDTAAIDSRQQAGSRLRAGAVLWDRFEKARTNHRIALFEAEQARRRSLLVP